MVCFVVVLLYVSVCACSNVCASFVHYCVVVYVFIVLFVCVCACLFC